MPFPSPSARLLALAFAVAPGGAARADAPPGPEPAVEAQSAAAAEPAVGVRLYGLIRQGGGGVALLRFGSGRARALRVGEEHGGFALREIFGEGVLLESPGGEVFALGFPERPDPGAARPPVGRLSREAGPEVGWPDGADPAESSPPAAASASEEAGGREDRRGEPGARAAGTRGERRFSRDEVRLRLLTELPRILSTAVVAPRVEGSEVAGLELIGFPTDTILGETGLAPGDVLLQVNGREVRGMESLAVLAQRFQTARQLELTVDRAGEVFSLRYRIE